MTHRRDTKTGSSRRRVLTSLAAGSAALAGCAGVLPDDDSEEASTDETANETETDGAETEGNAVRWPAIETGEVLSDFENLDEWSAQTGELAAAPDEALTGSQAAVVESDAARAEIGLRFPEGLDFEGWSASVAVKPESAERIIVEFLAPTRSERLASVRIVPEAFDGWFRFDCGSQQKPGGEPDISNVTGINIVADGPDGGPTRLLIDDLRRTESAESGAAIVAFYGGHDATYDVGAEMLKERGWAAAVAVSPERIGDGGRMGLDELRDLQDRGWDVCSLPQVSSPLPELSEDRQRTVLETARDALADEGFEDGSRHLFVPDGRMSATTYGVARDVHESAFLYNSGTIGVPPTETHAIPVIWGPALHTGVRRHLNHADQYQLLTVLRVPRIVDGDDAGGGSSMSIDEFGLLLDHLEHRGVEVITPSDLVDDTWERGGGETPDRERPEGAILEGGRRHAFEGAGSSTSATFDLDEGIVAADVAHDGDAEITVDVTTADSIGRSRTLTATFGRTTGRSIMAVSDGSYRLDVNADGAWTIDLSQPGVHSDDLVDLPFQADGTGSAVVGPLWTEGDVRLTATHDGDGAFIVDGNGADGSREQLVNRTGAFDNSRSYKAGGVVWLNIEADGEWVIEVTGGS
ncbi:polysaccharide deacetylase family protein (plasmid) [Haloferacaceae archaeon DSL9]